MWTVMTTEEFDRWLCEQDESTQERCWRAGDARACRAFSSAAFCRRAERLVASQHERAAYSAQRAADSRFFAFDPARQAIVLCAGDKTGNEKRFYKVMLPIADAQFTQYLMCYFKE